MEMSTYCGITLDWHYDQQYVDISIVNNILNQLAKYKQPPPKKPQYCPFEPKPINYGKQSDTIPQDKPSPPLDKDERKYIQQVVGSFLYCARAIDMILLLGISNITSQQANPTEKIMKRVRQLLDYMATHPEAKIRFCVSDMYLMYILTHSTYQQPKAEVAQEDFFAPQLTHRRQTDSTQHPSIS